MTRTRTTRLTIAAVVLLGATLLGGSPVPVAGEASEAPGAPRAATAISISPSHSCAVFDDGAVRCWGGAGAHLGQGPTADIGDEPGQMAALPPVDLGTGRTATAIAAGQFHTCALLDGGDVTCWGVRSFGQLGGGETGDPIGDDLGEMGDALVPVDLGTDRTATAITAGELHTCAILDNGDLKCWGYNSDGQLGQGSSDPLGDNAGEMGDALPPIDLGTGRTATAVTAGDSHTCALLDNVELKCWGYAAEGRLGQGNTFGIGDDPGEMGNALPPIDLGTGRTALAITAGSSHNCALLDDASIKCWGAGGSGQLGTGNSSPIGDNPGEMGDALAPIDLPTGRTATAVTAGRSHTCALLDNDSIVCWGAGNLGERGDGATLTVGDVPGEMGDALMPVELPAGRTARAVTAGPGRTCAVLDDGSLLCWGSGTGGALGSGSTENIGDEPGELAATNRIAVAGTVAAAAVTATMTRTPATVIAGSPITHTVTITNTGHQPLSGVAVSLPGGTCTPVAPIALATTSSSICTLRPTNANAPSVTRAATVATSNTVLGSPLSITSNTVTTTVARATRRPDALVRVGKKAFVGNNVYNRTSKKQTMKAATAKRPVKYTVRVQNDGNVTDTLRIKGTKNTKAFTVTYKAGKKNITKKVTKGKHRITGLAPGASRLITVTVTPKKATKVGAKTLTKVTVTSTSDTTKTDTVTTITRRR